MLAHRSENQPVQFEVFHEGLQSPGDGGFGKVGDCVVSYDEAVRWGRGPLKWSPLSLVKRNFTVLTLKTGVHV